MMKKNLCLLALFLASGAAYASNSAPSPLGERVGERGVVSA
jgi:hypothetical protein